MRGPLKVLFRFVYCALTRAEWAGLRLTDDDLNRQTDVKSFDFDR
jgi:hypothetical protein